MGIGRVVFPDLPYPGYSWRINHHIGRVTPEHLYHILWAANSFSRSSDPAVDINNYLIANSQWTPNIREDSGQPDAWRDYQQTLSELGLIYSLEILAQITLTPLGLAFLDGSLGFSEIITLQALRMQYPNGHHVAISTTQRAELAGTVYANISSFAELQKLTGVSVRPAVLVWRLLRRLNELKSEPKITVDEFESYLMRCSQNDEFLSCADAIALARIKGTTLPRLGSRQRRNAQDWIRFLDLTSIFAVTQNRQAVLFISEFGNQYAAEIDEISRVLERPNSFWHLDTLSQADRLRWYSEFGGVDLSIPELPIANTEASEHEFVGGVEESDQRGSFEESVAGGNIQLREFQGINFPTSPTNLAIQVVYSAELSTSAHRLHDQMVLLIAQTCRMKGASVYEDPGSVDLLVQHQLQEFIIEVKSVTPHNVITRLRYAVGQVLHYDFLRAPETRMSRRKVVALSAQIPPTSWSIPFLNNHLDMDLLALESGRLRVYSSSQVAIQLFG